MSGWFSYSLKARNSPTIAITQAITGIQEAARHEADRYQNARSRISGTKIAAVEPMTDSSRNHGSAKTTVPTITM
jgi:hypothetical protein